MEENQYGESISKWYDRIIEAGYYDPDKIAGALEKILKNHEKILELGVGTGLLAEKMISRGYNVSGIDFSPPMLECAKNRLGNKIKLYAQNVTSLNLPEIYDAAISEGGIWLATKDNNEITFLESHITDLKKNVLGMENVANHLRNNSLLVLAIQPIHEDLDELLLKNGAVYSQKVKYDLPFINKEYFVKQKGEIVAYLQCKFRRFTKTEQKKIMTEAGFFEVGFDKSDQFLVYRKEA